MNVIKLNSFVQLQEGKQQIRKGFGMLVDATGKLNRSEDVLQHILFKLRKEENQMTIDQILSMCKDLQENEPSRKRTR